MPHRHAMAQLLLVASYIILARFAADVIAGGFPNSLQARALHQSI